MNDDALQHCWRVGTIDRWAVPMQLNAGKFEVFLLEQVQGDAGDDGEFCEGVARSFVACIGLHVFCFLTPYGRICAAPDGMLFVSS
jgi:hypothetical protein